MDVNAKAEFEELARQDAMRYAQACHAADVAALERKERLRAERETLLLDAEGGRTRTTRHQYEKKQRKKAAKEEKKKKKQRSNKSSDGSDFNDDDDEGSEDWDSDVLDSDDDSSAAAVKQKKPPPKPRQASQKQMEYQARKRAEKEKQAAIVAERQQDIRKEKAEQAKRRLEFLLKQSDIFSHFGRVKEDTAKYGIVTTPQPSESANPKGHRAARDDNEEDLAEADEHEATYLTVQPKTLGFGQMRPYQLEGLNWMIGLQENGVNGILADEVSWFFHWSLVFFGQISALTLAQQYW